MKQPAVAVIGFGAIGQALLPLLLSRLGIEPGRVTVVCPDTTAEPVAAACGVRFVASSITAENYAVLLSQIVGDGDWIVNVSVGVGSADLIRWCRRNGVLYLDTCVEPWAGGYGSPTNPASATNYALREEALGLHEAGAPTAIVAHGANPGLVTHFVKAGLIELAALRGVYEWRSWADLARRLDIRVIQVAERDTQVSEPPSPQVGHFFNTWSVDGLLAEAWQCAELGWGSHEDRLPADGHRHLSGDRAGIVLDRHGAEVKVRSWVPSAGAQSAYLITHHEALSIASLMTIPSRDVDAPAYRPTVYYAYRPAPMTEASLGEWVRGGFREPGSKQILRDGLSGGFDELGVLFVFPGGAYWYGSTLDLDEARRIALLNNATTLQVAAGIVGALDWMRRHPCEGVVEAEAMDHESVLAVARPYLGDVSGVMTDWQPKRGSDLRWQDFALTEPAARPQPEENIS